MGKVTAEGIQPNPDLTEDLTLFQVMSSVLAASFGVQSKENKVRDFTRGKPVHFILAGIIFTIIFMLALILLVNLVV